MVVAGRRGHQGAHDTAATPALNWVKEMPSRKTAAEHTEVYALAAEKQNKPCGYLITLSIKRKQDVISLFKIKYILLGR